MTTTLAPPRTTAAVDECMNILESLPSNTDAVADLMRAEGITGEQGCPIRCVLANWLAKRLNTHLNVTCAHVCLHDGLILLPAVAAQFITAFDCGDYPDLITPSTKRNTP